jgi:hypothetical protein
VTAITTPSNPDFEEAAAVHQPRAALLLQKGYLTEELSFRMVILQKTVRFQKQVEKSNMETLILSQRQQTSLSGGRLAW